MDKVDIVEYQNLSEPVRVTVVTGLLNIPDTGVPKGGKKGQNLTKKSVSDLDTYWADPDDINSIEHITLNGEDVPVEDKTANIKVDAKTVGFESTNVAYTDKENTFTERQKFKIPYNPEDDTSYHGYIDASAVNVSKIKYDGGIDTGRTTNNQAILTSESLKLKRQINTQNGSTQYLIQLDHNGIKKAEYVNHVLANYGYKFPKTYPNKNVTLATIEDLTAQFGALNIQNGDGKDSIQSKYTGEIDATHFGNHCYGESAAVIGAANFNGGNRTLLSGKMNRNSAPNSLIVGLGNGRGINANPTLDIISGEQLFVFGTLNSVVNGNGNVVLGAENTLSNVRYTTIIGRGNIINNTSLYEGKCVVGRFNNQQPDTMFEVGVGDYNNRVNGFEVLKDGRAKVQNAPKDNDDVVRKLELDNVNARYVSTSILGG